MTTPDRSDLEERLREVSAPAPPPDLVERLQAEIPERPSVVPFPGERPAAAPARSNRWLIAATVAVAVIGVSITYKVSLQSPSPEFYALDSPRPQDATGQSPASQSPPSPSMTPQLTTPQAGESAILESAPIEKKTEGEPIASSTEPAQFERVLRELSEDGQEVPLPVVTDESIRAGRAAGTDDAGARQRLAEDPNVRAMRAAPAGPTPGLQELPSAEAESLYDSREQAPPVEELELPAADMVLAEPPVRMESRERLRSAPRSERVPLPMTAPPSTGGTAEPNDEPYGDTFFESYGVNPFIDTEDDALSTFALDVDTGSYTVARSYLDRGHLPPPAAVRVEEMVNFFDYGDAGPSSGDFAMQVEGAPTPFAESDRYRLLRFNVRARDIAAKDRKPATLVFVVDVSGSMNRQNRLDLVKKSLYLLLDQLTVDDRVGLVVYGSRGAVLLQPTGDLELIRKAIERLQPGGSTNVEEGLALAYQLVERNRRDGAIHRIVLCSDGVANVGRTGPDSILDQIASAAENGIELTTVGFGMGNYNDVLMEQLADRGEGNYAYVDSLAEARRVFVENLTGTLQTVARQAKVQVEFDPAAVSRYRLLGYENRNIADERFRDDSVDAGEIGAGHSVTALYEIKLRSDVGRRSRLATLHLRWESVERGRVIEDEVEVRLSDLEESWQEASADFRLASLVAEYAEILRRSYWAREGDLEDLLARAQSVSVEFPGDVDVAEFVALVGKAMRLFPTRAEPFGAGARDEG